MVSELVGVASLEAGGVVPLGLFKPYVELDFFVLVSLAMI